MLIHAESQASGTVLCGAETEHQIYGNGIPPLSAVSGHRCRPLLAVFCRAADDADTTDVSMVGDPYSAAFALMI
jgi:hypothetical protein